MAEGQIGAPACAAGFLCALGECTRCASHEQCGDRIDNDCNGLTDDDCGEGGAGGRADLGSTGGGFGRMSKPAMAGAGG